MAWADATLGSLGFVNKIRYKTVILNKTLDFADLREPGANNMIKWFADKYKKIYEQKLPVRKDGRDNFNRRYWEYFFTTHNTPVPPQGRILDVGCGGSIFTYYLREYYHPCYVLGLDCDQSYISKNIAQAKIFPDRSVNFMPSYLQAFKPTQDLFDAIFSISVIEHDPQDRAFIARCSNLLKLGGMCSITFDYHKSRPYIPGGRNYNQRGVKRIVEYAKKHEMELRENKYFFDNTDYENGLPGIPYTFGSLFFTKL